MPEISYKVEAHSIDRLTFTLGPETQTFSANIPWIYVVQVAAEYDDGSGPLQLGTAAFLARPDGGQAQLQAAIDSGQYDCIAANASFINDAYRIPAARSKDLNALKAASDSATNATASGSPPKKRVARAPVVA